MKERSIKSFLLSVVFLSTISFVGVNGEPCPISLTIELAKDTLAFMEPTLLTATITNTSFNDVAVVENLDLELYEMSSGLKVFLITPDDDISRFKFGGNSQPIYTTYWLLPPGESITVSAITWWACYLPVEYYRTLEKAPSGTYKMFATYKLRLRAGVENRKAISDTVEFTFLPLEKEHHSVIQLFDELHADFLTGYMPGYRGIFEKIVESNTLYSEAVWAGLIGSMSHKEYDKMTIQMDSFYKVYPNSDFKPYLLVEEFITYRNCLAYGFGQYRSPLESHEIVLDSKAEAMVDSIHAVMPSSYIYHRWRSGFEKFNDREILKR
jgi:hypothetical protein